MKHTASVAIGFTTPASCDAQRELALECALGLAKLNHNVLFIDLSAAKQSHLPFSHKRPELTLKDFLDGSHEISELIYECTHGLHVISTNFCKKSLLKATQLELFNLIEAFDRINHDFEFLIMNFPDKSSANCLTLLEACHFQILCIEPSSKSISRAFKLLNELKNNAQANDVYMVPTSVSSHSHGWKLFNSFNAAVLNSLNLHAKYLASVLSPSKNPISKSCSSFDLVKKIETLKDNSSYQAHKFFEFKNMSLPTIQPLNSIAST